MPANTLKDFVAYLRANEKKVTEADAGVGSISNLACSVFHSIADVHPTVASYRGTPQATMDLVAGNVDFGCNQIVNIVPARQDRHAQGLCGDRRQALADAAGRADHRRGRHAGFQPARSGSACRRRKARRGRSSTNSTRRSSIALDDPVTVKRFAELGYDVVPPEKRSAAYFDKFYKDEVALWAKVLGGLGMGGK